MILLDISERQVQKNNNGVKVVTLPANEYGLEHDKRSLIYISILWLVSFLAMVTNVTRALFVKVKKWKTPIRQILWQMGRDHDHFSSFAVDWFSKFNHQAKCGAASWRALDLFYNYYSKIKPQLDGNLESKLTRYWIEKMENRQAVTNRLKVLTILLKNAFAKFGSEPEVRLFSVASGSAQAVVDAILGSSQNVKVLLLDIDATAIEEAKSLVAKYGLEEKFSFICGTVKKIEDVCHNFRPHVVEMVGFLDYRPEEKAVTLVAKIKKCLPDGGILITCNIKKNREKPFLDWVLLWSMDYKDEFDLARIFNKGGFLPEKTEILFEPFGIHGICICQS